MRAVAYYPKPMKRLTLVSFIMLTLGACQSLPNLPHTPDSMALTHRALLPAHDTRLGVAVDEQSAHYPQMSGYYPIVTGADAFASRSVLADMAEHSIDAQYYIWHNDEAGQLMLKDLWQAAERGVVVRLLLDDFNNTPELDALLWRFSQHHNIQVRLMNPAAHRTLRFLDFITRPKQMNARMHNKSMIYDNRVAIIGGRNIGNEYLNNDKRTHFADLDVLLIGGVVNDIDTSFESYWQSSVAYDIETIVKAPKVALDFISSLDEVSPPPESLLERLQGDKKDDEAQRELTLRRYRSAVANSTIGEDLLGKRVPFRWSPMRFVADNPKKLTLTAKDDELLIHQASPILGKPTQSLDVISSYFVPTHDGVAALTHLAKSGVRVRILTNSYDATDVGAVHSGYAHHRRALLSGGVRLFELRSTAGLGDDNKNRLVRTKGETTTSLHAKAFSVDGKSVFIGSYNVDPRSANINTELGVIITDERLAGQMAQAMGDGLLHEAYEVKLGKDGLEWHTVINDTPVVYTDEPNMTLLNRFGVWFLSWLPIDWLL